MIFVLVYEDIKAYHQQGEKYDEKSKKEIKMTRFPATGIEP